MSKKYIDVMPPYPPKEHEYHRENPKKKQKRKAKSLFWSLVLMILLLSFCYIFLKSETQNVITPVSTTNTSNNQFELFDGQGQSSLTHKTGPITIRITDCSSNVTSANSIRDILLADGYQIEKIDKASTPCSQTIIYYKDGQESLAQKIKTILSSKTNIESQKSDKLENSYDILIVVGD